MPDNNEYYIIDDSAITYMAQDELLLNDFKENIMLKKLFDIDKVSLTPTNIEIINTSKIKVFKIITIELLVGTTNKKFNFILFRNDGIGKIDV